LIGKPMVVSFDQWWIFRFHRGRKCD
jgi:hypothetical protein